MESVWHVNVIPEEELLKSGFINSFNQRRLDRIARKREAEGKTVRLVDDFGKDFLAKDKDGSYHAGQAKRYAAKVSCGALGSFLAVSNYFLKSESFLYTTNGATAPLQEVIRQSAADDGKLIHADSLLAEAYEYFEFKSDSFLDAVAPGAGKVIQGIREGIDGIILNSADRRGKLVHIVLPLDALWSSSGPVVPEISVELRPYQKEAVEAILAADGISALELFCGGGKTVIVGHALVELSSEYGLIVCIAPLLVSVNQLLERLSAFLPGYEVLLVDSDRRLQGNQTTSAAAVESFLGNKSGKSKLIFSTFKSAVSVLSAPLRLLSESFKSAYLVVDEAHNLSNKDEANFIRSFKRALLLSATMPEVVGKLEPTDWRPVPMKEKCDLAWGIKNGFCVPYQVWLPWAGDSKVASLPEELQGLDLDSRLDLSRLCNITRLTMPRRRGSRQRRSFWSRAC